jgi:ATP-dependent Lon protease
MTGELTLTGRVLPIGGLKEKLLAAIRNGIREVLLPEDNREDWVELDREIRSSIAVHFVGSAEEAFTILFGEEVQRPAGPEGKGAARKSPRKSPSPPAAPRKKRAGA